MPLDARLWALAGAGAGVAVGWWLGVAYTHRRRGALHSEPKLSEPDQVQRAAAARYSNNARVLNIDAFYKRDAWVGKRVLVTGSNRGIGLALVEALVEAGAHVIATCRKVSLELLNASPAQVIEGVDVTSDACMVKLCSQIDRPVDVVINNAGYFYEPLETISSLNFAEQTRMFEICAVGPLRVTAALFNDPRKLLRPGAKVAIISSQGGSIKWRDVQCPDGHDYGHHASKAAANMIGKLLANELRADGVGVVLLHPGFNRTDMTAKYKAIWDVEGAVDASVGARRVLTEISRLGLERSGAFVNCEDGLDIPW